MAAATGWHELVDRLAGDPALLDAHARVEMLHGLEGLRRWLAEREATLLAVCERERDDLAVGARDVVQLQQQTGATYGDAKRRETRAVWFGQLPTLAAAVAAGRLGLAQADDLCALAQRLDADERQVLRDAAPALVAELEQLTPRRARKRLAEFERSLDDDAGTDRLNRQRAANSLRTRKAAHGMTEFLARLDPVTATKVRRAIDREVTEIWRRDTGAGSDASPSDVVITNEGRRAQALVELIEAGAIAPPGTNGSAEVIVVIDYQTLLSDLEERGISKLADGTPLPPSEIRRIACDAKILPVVLGGASRALDIGRAARLATPAQRTALRALHETCCIAGCDVDVDYCDIHHITWWRYDGTTDLENLAPVCSKHHHLIHNHGWILTLDHTRTGHLTKQPPDHQQQHRLRARPIDHITHSATRIDAPSAEPVNDRRPQVVPLRC